MRAGNAVLVPCIGFNSRNAKTTKLMLLICRFRCSPNTWTSDDTMLIIPTKRGIYLFGRAVMISWATLHKQSIVIQLPVVS